MNVFYCFLIFLLYFSYIYSFSPDNSIIIHGYRFAVLDDSNPLSTNLSCQINPINIPSSSSGWKITSSLNPIHRIAVASYPWGTSCLVMDNGISLSTQSLQICSENALIESNGKYAVNQCDQKILFYQEEPVDITSDIISCPSLSNTEHHCSHWESDNEDDIDISDYLTMHYDGGDSLKVSQSIDIEEEQSNYLSTGFIFSVSSKCSGDVETNINTQIYSATVNIKYNSLDNTEYIINFPSKCTGKWSEKSLSIIPEDIINSMEISFYYKSSSSSSSYWKDITLTSLDNVLSNPSFHGNLFSSISYWNKTGLGYLPDIPRVDDDDSPLSSSILLPSSREYEYSNSIQGAFQVLSGSGWDNNTLIRSLYIGGYSKTYELGGTMDDNFGILLDIEYADKTSLYGQVLPFQTGTTPSWVYSDKVIQLTKPAISVNVSIILRQHTGIAWIDNIIVSIIPPRDILSCNMGIFGDPRIKIISNDLYSFQTPGEYTLFTSGSLTMQSRHVTCHNSSGTLVSALAIGFGAHSISIQFDKPGKNGWQEGDTVSDFPSIYLNGILQSSDTIFIPNTAVITRTDYTTYTPTLSGDISSSTSISSETSISSQDSSNISPLSSSLYSPIDISTYNYISVIDDDESKEIHHIDDTNYSFTDSIQASLYTIHFPQGEILIHSRYILDDDYDITGEPPKRIAGYLQAIVSLESNYCATLDGLFGNGAKGALTSNTGDSINLETASQDSITTTAESWKISSASSLFQYKNGLSSNDYYQPDHKISDLNMDDECYLWAIISCNRQALTSLNDSCIEDILLLSYNPFIIQNYHTIEGQLRLITQPLFKVIGIDNIGNIYTDESISSTFGFTLSILISIGILCMLGCVTCLYKRRKKPKKKQETTMIEMEEMEDMISDNERIERFE